MDFCSARLNLTGNLSTSQELLLTDTWLYRLGEHFSVNTMAEGKEDEKGEGSGRVNHQIREHHVPTSFSPVDFHGVVADRDVSVSRPPISFSNPSTNV